MAIEVITVFPDKATVRIISYVYNDDGALTDPTGSIKITIKDPDSVQKAGYIGVSSSSSFTAGLVVTGAISGSKGLVVSKPDGTTLELQQVTGVWQSGEGITDSGSGTSTTTSALLGADMTQQDSTTGVYEYYYHKGTGLDPMDDGEWRGEVVEVDGSGVNAVTSVGNFNPNSSGFFLNKISDLDVSTMGMSTLFRLDSRILSKNSIEFALR